MLPQLLSFLYASMPLPDSVDYPREFWQENIECSIQARAEMSWGATIPEREWRHFVLPVRVNNENLDHSRILFYQGLRPRVQGLSMTEAILEVNHWCHEHVTYTPSDERTSSPLASIRTAHGRCGEESTLLVAALRSVGIPARQVYTPRWAHTDDNHAWVEAWADGQWHFLGACEPEPVLDLGWFNAPASRAMLMHTKVFGHEYDGPEQVMQQTPCFTEIDVTANYAPTARSFVRVVDTQGNPVPDAAVEFKIYNYAEFYTVATHHTDRQGLASMQAGIGDLLAWTYHDGTYGFDRIHIGSTDTLTLTLSHQAAEAFECDINIVPPTGSNNVPFVSAEQRHNNDVRLAYEDSLRAAYVSTFLPSFPAWVASEPEYRQLFVASRGNHATLSAFLPDGPDPLRLALLQSLSAKDLRDVSLDVLLDAVADLPERPSRSEYRDVANPYILSPRVANEMLVPHRRLFRTEVPAPLQQDWHQHPQHLIDWVRDSIQLDLVHNPQHLRMTPVGTWRHRVTDPVSRNIFFVSMARTVGIAARIDPVTSKVQYADADGRWLDVDFGHLQQDAPSAAPVSQLSLTYAPTRYLVNPKYYTHFTLSRIDGGAPTLLNYGEEDSWQSLFSQGPQGLDAGDYLLTTGTRMADGSVLAHLSIFPTQDEQHSTLPITLRQAETGLQVIGNFNSEDLYTDLQSGPRSLLSTTGRGYYVLGLIASGQEPTNHALRDIARCREQLEAWGGHLVLLFRDQADAQRFQAADFPALPRNTHFGYDTNGLITQELCREMRVSSTALPIFIIADTFNRIVFLSEGYTIGLGDQLVTNLISLQ